MSWRHVWAVTGKEFNHIVRDRSTLILVLFTPTLLLLLMASAVAAAPWTNKSGPEKVAMADSGRLRSRSTNQRSPNSCC